MLGRPLRSQHQRRRLALFRSAFRPPWLTSSYPQTAPHSKTSYAACVRPSPQHVAHWFPSWMYGPLRISPVRKLIFPLRRRNYSASWHSTLRCSGHSWVRIRCSPHNVSAYGLCSPRGCTDFGQLCRISLILPCTSISCSEALRSFRASVASIACAIFGLLGPHNMSGCASELTSDRT